jgi:hypothetical protein
MIWSTRECVKNRDFIYFYRFIKILYSEIFMFWPNLKEKNYFFGSCTSLGVPTNGQSIVLTRMVLMK